MSENSLINGGAGASKTKTTKNTKTKHPDTVKLSSNVVKLLEQAKGLAMQIPHANLDEIKVECDAGHKTARKRKTTTKNKQTATKKLKTSKNKRKVKIV
jgi:hypothetical protein